MPISFASCLFLESSVFHSMKNLKEIPISFGFFLPVDAERNEKKKKKNDWKKLVQNEI